MLVPGLGWKNPDCSAGLLSKMVQELIVCTFT